MLKGIDNLTIYVFPLNILSEKSRTISRNVWCATDRAAAWNAWMIDGTPPSETAGDCVYSDADILKLARKYDITGTPVIFFKDGSRMVGMPPSAEDFSKALSAAR
jgi:thiol:disulfide interchange protein DsbC